MLINCEFLPDLEITKIYKLNSNAQFTNLNPLKWPFKASNEKHWVAFLLL